MFTIIAVLFIGSTVHVAYEVSATDVVETFTVENNEIGASELQSKLAPILAQVQGKPMVCMTAAEGYSLKDAAFEGVIFNEEVRRFMLAQPQYLLEAKALGLSSQDPKALLRACQGVFPAKRS